MKSHLISVLTLFLAVTLIAPAVFLSFPSEARAGLPVFVEGTVEAPFSIISAIKNTVTSIASVTSAAANVAMQVNAYVLQPLAFVLSGNLLKAITASIIGFVNSGNGTGRPMFVQNLPAQMQSVGDAQAFMFFSQFSQTSNSPFASAIISSLRTNYLQLTSLAGFYAANRCTLTKSSSNIKAFLAGNWSKGGVRAWFALTTQDQNNPFTLYQSSQSKLASIVGNGIGGATGAALAQLNWGQGFLSWCGGDAAKNADTLAPGDPSWQPASETQTTSTQKKSTVPGAPCTKSDGSPGTIQTPGSTIKAALDKALGSTQDKLVQMGNIASEINGILGNIGTVMNTANFAAAILGGPDSGGLFGAGQPSGSNSESFVSQYRDSPDYLGVTQSNVYQNAAMLPSSGGDMLSRVMQYESSWNTIRTAANTASTSVTNLIQYCTAQQQVAGNYNSILLENFMAASAAQISSAQKALANELAPVFDKVSAAERVVAAARAMVQKIQDDVMASTTTAGNTYAADIQTLQTMPPTAMDIAVVQQDAQSFGTASASATDSLAVSAASLLDQMNGIAANAAAAKEVCNPLSLAYRPETPPAYADAP